MTVNKTKKLTIIGVFSAMAVVLMLVEIPIPQLLGFKYDPSDIAALLVGFMIGPIPGILTVLIKDLLYFAIRGTDVVGIFMNAAAGSMLVGFSALFYRKRKTKTTAVVSLSLATLLLVVGMDALNMLVYPPYLKVSYMFIFKNYLWVITIFNLVKAIVDGFVTFLIYKKTSNVFKLEAWKTTNRKWRSSEK